MGKHVLLITERPVSAADVAELTGDGGAIPPGASVYVAVPLHSTARSSQAVIDDLEMDVAASRGERAIDLPNGLSDPSEVALDASEQVLADVLSALAAAGLTVEGEVTPVNPLETVGDIVSAKAIDEVVVALPRQTLGGMLHTDLAGRIKRHFGVDVLRVHTHSE